MLLSVLCLYVVISCNLEESEGYSGHPERYDRPPKDCYELGEMVNACHTMITHYHLYRRLERIIGRERARMVRDQVMKCAVQDFDFALFKDPCYVLDQNIREFGPCVLRSLQFKPYNVPETVRKIPSLVDHYSDCLRGKVRGRIWRPRPGTHDIRWN